MTENKRGGEGDREQVVFVGSPLLATPFTVYPFEERVPSETVDPTAVERGVGNNFHITTGGS